MGVRMNVHHRRRRGYVRYVLDNGTTLTSPATKVRRSPKAPIQGELKVRASDYVSSVCYRSVYKFDGMNDTLSSCSSYPFPSQPRLSLHG